MWIFGTFIKESFVFFLPGFTSVLIAASFPDLGEKSLAFGLLATALIDSGHVYTTSWRTWLHAEERKSSQTYWLVPLFFFSLFTLWCGLKLPGLWGFVVYSTLYHHVRQVYGFSKWYQALNRRQDKGSDLFLYALSVIPILSYHFRAGVKADYYSEQDLFLFPHAGVLRALILIYFVLLGLWMIREMRLWKNGIREPNRLLSVAYPALIYGYCFFLGETVTQVLFPLLFIHGTAYCAVIALALQRTQERFTDFKRAIVVVVVTAVIFGLGESWVEENVLGQNLPGLTMALITGLYLTPLYCHYAFDAIIWRRKHREAGKLVGGL